MILSECSRVCTASKVKVKEHGSCAIFLNPERKRFVTVEIDGCLVCNQLACDWAVVPDGTATILVELKGKDVKRAIAQIEATLERISHMDTHFPKPYSALVVCSRSSSLPTFTTYLQRARSRFHAKYRSPLHVVSGTREYVVGRLLSFAPIT